MRFFAALVVAAWGLPLVFGRALLEPRGVPLPPDQDPFYVAPAGFESTAPGTILRSRTVISSIFGAIPSGLVTYQLLYRTTAINGSAIATVTTVFKPLKFQKDKFVSFQTAYDSSASQCNPSYEYQLLSAQEDAILQLEFLLVEAYLLSGYIVASADYEGPDTAFSPGHLEGYGTLDGMRAVSNFYKTLGLSTPTPDIVGTGYSGGAIATGWAASLQPIYAPELPIKGWAIGGTPANLTGTLSFLDDTLFSGFVFAGVAGLAKPSAYGATLQPLLDSILTPYGRSLIDFANANCAPAVLLRAPEMSLYDPKVQSRGRAILYDPVIVAIGQQTTMGLYPDQTPKVPVYMYHASQDEIIPYVDAAVTNSAWCANGANVEFVTYAAGGHLTTEIIGFPEVFKFVEAAFAGTAGTGACSQSTVLSDQLDPLALGVNLEPILIKLIEDKLDLGKFDSKLIANVTAARKA